MTKQESLYKIITESKIDTLIALPMKFRDLKNDYMINNFGHIWHKINRKLKSNHIDINGYQKCSLTINGKEYTASVHRLVAQTFIPNPENKPCVNHIDGNKENNSVKNLEWVTHKENTAHAIKMGLFNPKSTENKLRGVDSSKNIYTEESIHEICKLLEKGLGETEISRILNIDRRTVESIKRGNNWKHISCLYDIKKPKKRVPLDNDIIKKAEELSLGGIGTKNIIIMLGLPLGDNYIREQIAWIRRKTLKMK